MRALELRHAQERLARYALWTMVTMAACYVVFVAVKWTATSIMQLVRSKIRRELSIEQQEGSGIESAGGMMLNSKVGKSHSKTKTELDGRYE